MSLLPLIPWAFDPVLIAFGPLQIRWYGLIWVSAFLIGRAWMQRVARTEPGVGDLALDPLLTNALLATIIGARLVHCLVYEPEHYLTHPLDIFKVWIGGMASHGGAIGLVLALAWHVRKHALPSTLWLLDRATVPAALGAALIRVANFLGSDILGLPTDGTWGVVFTAVDHRPRHPVQLYEATAYLLIAALLFTLYRRWRQHPPHGLLTGVFLVAVFSARTALEVFKSPQSMVESTSGGWLHLGQWLSVPFVVMGLVLMGRAWVGRRAG